MDLYTTITLCVLGLALAPSIYRYVSQAEDTQRKVLELNHIERMNELGYRQVVVRLHDCRSDSDPEIGTLNTFEDRLIWKHPEDDMEAE